MSTKAVLAPFLLAIGLLVALPVAAQQARPLTVYFFRDGQAVAVSRTGFLSGDPQADAEALLAELLAGPTLDEQAQGLTSALPPATEQIAVAVSGEAVTLDLHIPLDFLRNELDPGSSDAIVEQVVKTVYPLGLYHVQVRAEDELGALQPVSAFLPRPSLTAPTLPLNDDPIPDRMPTEPGTVGQPPVFGQGQPQGALTGTTAWLSAGHGWHWSDTLNRWTTQRGNSYGLVEDFSNAEAINYYLARYLWNAGAEAWLVRERSMSRHEIIVDNDDGAPVYTETGSWLTSSTPGYNGGTYRWRSTYSSLSGTATWTPELPEAGWYAVWAWYRHGSNRPADARYEIHHAGGVTAVSLSQEVHGMTWRYLGEYYFEAGTAGYVTLLTLSNDPGQAVIADAIRFGGGLGSIAEPGGSSGRPRWEEAAQYWARYQGAPAELTSSDVTVRPLYAEWEAAKGYPGEAENAVYISWHTNAGELSGTMSFIHSTEPTTGSAELQDWVHAELISDLRAAWNPDWVDLHRRSADFGEVRELSTMPGLVLEIAYHDTEDPGDADDLREPVFRQIAARAVYQGIVKYQAQRQGRVARLLPEPPGRLVARNTAPGQVTLSWAPPPCCDGVLGDAAAAYKVYHSTDGRAFDNGTSTAESSLTLSGLAPGSLHFYRVTAVNEGGESFPTPVVAVRTPAQGGSIDFLLVDGFDRLDQAAMVPQWEATFLGTDQRMFLERMNRYDYAVEHGLGLSACNLNLAFDGAVNEAIETGDVALDGYPAVDWFVGEDSAADKALSAAERARLADYLSGGGRLLLSGAEIGFDLVEQGQDPAFYHDLLRTNYLGDAAGTSSFAGVPGSMFDGLAGSLDDGTGNTYKVDSPDRLGPTAGSSVVLRYVGGTADGAAVAYGSDSPGDLGVVYLGFPLETVTDPAARAALLCSAAGYLLPSQEPPPFPAIPRLINPGFEQGPGQSAWQTRASNGSPLFYSRHSLPGYVEPANGDWLSWLGGYTPGVSASTALTQAVALPAGEPTATLSLAWFVHPVGAAAPNGDHLFLELYDPSGTLRASLLTLTSQSAADTWQTAKFDVGAFAGQTVQVVLRTVSSGTAFFVDDVNLTTSGPPGPDEFRALWVDAYHSGIKSRQEIDELIETAQAGNFDALVVQVRRRGDTYYPSTLDPWAPDATPGFDALSYLIERAHVAAIEVHAWATTLALWDGSTPPANPSHTFNVHGPGAAGRDYWLMTSSTGAEQASGVYYLDPGHPDVVDYTVAVYAELASNYDLDGVHLDRVRYAWQDWGYNPTSLERFQVQTGRDDVPAPTDGEWLQWRRDQVTALVRRIYLTVTAINPRLRISAALSVSGGAPTASYPWETRTPYTHHLQDWRSWLEEGILDLGLPMTYKREYDQAQKADFDGWIAWEKDHQYGRGVAVGTALYLNTVADSMAQWLRARQPSPLGNRALGLCGYSYATPSNDGTSRRDLVNDAVTELFDQPASTPALPWKDTPSLGHLMGNLTQPFPCHSLDGYPLGLEGPQDRGLLSDGSGWFGAVDLPPGDYLLTVDVVTPSITLHVPVSVVAGVVTEQRIRLPGCASHQVYLPLVVKRAEP